MQTAVHPSRGPWNAMNLEQITSDILFVHLPRLTPHTEHTKPRMPCCTRPRLQFESEWCCSRVLFLLTAIRHISHPQRQAASSGTRNQRVAEMNQKTAESLARRFMPPKSMEAARSAAAQPQVQTDGVTVRDFIKGAQSCKTQRELGEMLRLLLYFVKEAIAPNRTCSEMVFMIMLLFRST